ncbi:hypothetical protein M501DRAFT_902699, partial [Patellaria atrata CBS 101060]
RAASEESRDSTELTPHVCLCPPEPKVPRPRNAFILYRQHHQANIAAQHPGLPNPDISKILGEQWKAEEDKVREQWKILAGEEKERHQAQYPDYRFKPRRQGRNNSGALTSSVLSTSPDSGQLCARCGGRSI